MLIELIVDVEENNKVKDVYIGVKHVTPIFKEAVEKFLSLNRKTYIIDNYVKWSNKKKKNQHKERK